MGKLLCHQATHGWITAALSREMRCMKGHATFETIENKLKFTRATHAISRVHVVKMFEDDCSFCES